MPQRLHYVSDAVPGIRRERRGKGFRYIGPDGQPLRDRAELDRIRRLAIPPAYTQVWICGSPAGHIQATGRDARGRKQYRYHPDWRRARDADKFERMLEFGDALPRIRARVERDLKASDPRPGRETVLATVVRLLDTTLVRIGNDEYARSNGSYGLTTLRNRHARVQGPEITLQFRGKSGVLHRVALEDPRVARIVRRCQAMPGQALFQYVGEDGELRGVGSEDVNDYLREASGDEFTAKNFRTWHASVHALALLGELPGERGDDEPFTRRELNDVLADVAKRLGNTVAVCRKSYVHPRVLEATQARLRAASEAVAAMGRRRGWSVAERQLVAFLTRPPSTPARGAAGV